MKDYLGFLKDAPLWLLAAITLSCGLLWIYPQLDQALPAAARAFPRLFCIIGAISIVCLTISRLYQRHLSRGEERRAIAQTQLGQVYDPLKALFLDRHITGATGIFAGRFHERLANARDILEGSGKLRRRLKRVYRALGDRQIESSLEMEFGGEFPIQAITDLVRLRAVYVDDELFQFVRRANRSRYEEQPSDSDLTADETALVNYIWRRQSELRRVVTPSRV